MLQRDFNVLSYSHYNIVIFGCARFLLIVVRDIQRAGHRQILQNHNLMKFSVAEKLQFSILNRQVSPLEYSVDVKRKSNILKLFWIINVFDDLELWSPKLFQLPV